MAKDLKIRTLNQQKEFIKNKNKQFNPNEKNELAKKMDENYANISNKI